MSGDVQPRKRKEKRRKRAEEEYHIQRIRRASLEDDDAGTPPPMLVNPLEQSMENVTLHIHKEGGTGGHWCARIIFFALFTVLIGLIGVIIFEYRGTTDVDTPVASSRWAMIFEGWVDDVVPSHEETHSEKKHDEEHEEDEGLGSDEENDEEEGNDDDEGEDGDEDKNAVSQDDDEDEEEEEENDDDNSPEQDQVEDEEDEDNSENDEGFVDDEDNEDDEDDIGVLEEIEYEESVEADDDEVEEEEEDIDEDDIENISVPDLDVSIEGVIPSSKQDDEDDELDYEFAGINGVNEIEDDSAEPLEEIEEEEPEEIINEIEIEPLVEEITEEESTSVAVKFGVGVALVVAAHFVLVRRWNNVDMDVVTHDGVPDLTRRNTIVPPGNIKQLNVTSNLSQKQQHTQELKNKYKDLQNENIQLVTNKFVSAVGSQKDVKKEPEVTTASQIKKKESQEVFTSESERFSGTENESDYDYDEDELDEEEIEEEEDEYEVEEEEEEELDDSQLVAKLEAKYGKLPTPSQSEEEEEEEDESEEDEEEEEEEFDERREAEIENWKRSNAPKIVHSGGTDKTKNNRQQDLTKPRQGTSTPRGGRQSADIGHSEDHNEITFQEEIENWLAGDLDN